MQEKLGLGRSAGESSKGFVDFSEPSRKDLYHALSLVVVGLLRKSVKMWRRREETMEQALAVIGMSKQSREPTLA